MFNHFLSCIILCICILLPIVIAKGICMYSEKKIHKIKTQLGQGFDSMKNRKLPNLQKQLKFFFF